MKWLYHKTGTCATCDADGVRLYRPDPSNDVRLVLFPAICSTCRDTNHGR